MKNRLKGKQLTKFQVFKKLLLGFLKRKRKAKKFKIA